MSTRKQTPKHGSGADAGDSKNKIRIRGKRLDQVDETKLTLAYWLLAKRLVEDKTDSRTLSEPEVLRVMERMEHLPPAKAVEPPAARSSAARSTSSGEQPADHGDAA